MIRDEITQLLKSLHLRKIEEILDKELKYARQKSLSDEHRKS